MDSVECGLIRWSEQPLEVTRAVIVGQSVLVEASAMPEGDAPLRRMPYAASAVAELHYADYAVILLAIGGSGAADEPSDPPARATTTAALELLDPGRKFIDYAVFCSHGSADGHQVCLLGIDREIGHSIRNGWVIGDRLVDLDRGRALGLGTILVASERGVSTWNALVASERSAIDLRSSIFAEAVRHLLLAARSEGYATA